MDSFEPIDVYGTSAAAPAPGFQLDRDLEDDELEVALLTSNREAFAGFWNLTAIAAWPARGDTAPWRER